MRGVHTKKEVCQEDRWSNNLVHTHLFYNCRKICLWQPPIQVLVPHVWHRTKHKSDKSHSTWMPTHNTITLGHTSNLIRNAAHQN